MSEQAEKVQLYVYDLSRGLARQLSMGLLGKQIDAIYHTSIVVGAKRLVILLQELEASDLMLTAAFAAVLLWPGHQSGKSRQHSLWHPRPGPGSRVRVPV